MTRPDPVSPLEHVPAAIGPQRDEVAQIVAVMAAMDIGTWLGIHQTSAGFFDGLSAEDEWAVAEGRRAAVDAVAMVGREEGVRHVGRILVELAASIAREIAPHLSFYDRPARPAELPALEQLVVEGLSTTAVLAMNAVVARDLIGSYGFTQHYYDLMTTPWRQSIGPPHPDDEETRA